MYAPAVSGRHLEEKVTLKLIKTKTPGYVVQRLVDTLRDLGKVSAALSP